RRRAGGATGRAELGRDPGATDREYRLRQTPRFRLSRVLLCRQGRQDDAIVDRGRVLRDDPCAGEETLPHRRRGPLRDERCTGGIPDEPGRARPATLANASSVTLI